VSCGDVTKGAKALICRYNGGRFEG